MYGRRRDDELQEDSVEERGPTHLAGSPLPREGTRSHSEVYGELAVLT